MPDIYNVPITIGPPPAETPEGRAFREYNSNWVLTVIDLLEHFYAPTPSSNDQAKRSLLVRKIRENDRTIGRRELLDDGFRIYWHEGPQIHEYVEFKENGTTLRVHSTVQGMGFTFEGQHTANTAKIFTNAFNYLIVLA